MKSSNHLSTSLLFIDYIEVGIPFTKFSKATPIPKKYAKSANELPTMNSTPVILKSAIDSSTSILPCTDKIKSEVDKPNADYEQYS